MTHNPQAEALLGDGNHLRQQGRHSEAYAALKSALALFRAEKDRVGEANTILGIGHLQRAVGKYNDARKSYVDTLQAFRKMNNAQGEANALAALAELESAAPGGSESVARGHYLQALPLFQANHDPVGAANMWRGLAELEANAGRFDEAHKAYTSALQLYRAHKAGGPGEANALVGLAELNEKTGDSENSRQCFTLAAELGRKLAYSFAISRSQAGLARLAERDLFLASHRAKKSDSAKPEESLKKIERRVLRIYGAGKLAHAPADEEQRRAHLLYFLPKTREWTVVLMCDIRGYTTAMARMDPEMQVAFLDTYLSRGTALIQAKGGGVDKYMGDAILSFFRPEPGVSSDQVVHNALEAAFDIVSDKTINGLFAESRSHYEDLDKNLFGVGVGLASGIAKFGEIGDKYREEYTLIGRAVNLASRVQSLSIAGEVLCTRECWNRFSLDSLAHENFTAALCPADQTVGRMKGYENDVLVKVERMGSSGSLRSR